MINFNQQGLQSCCKNSKEQNKQLSLFCSFSLLQKNILKEVII